MLNFFLLFQFANMFEACSDWLLYISEWRQGSTNLSNVKVTTKVAVSSLLGDTSSLQDYGSAMMHNFSSKDVKSVVNILFIFQIYLLIFKENQLFVMIIFL